MSEAKPMRIIVIAIFALVFLGLIVYITVFKFRPAAEYTEWEIGCSESVKAHALFGLANLQRRPPIKCPPLSVDIDADLGSSKGQTQAKKEIAKVMRACWGNIYNQGKYDLFKEETVYCAPCAIVRFDDENEKVGHFTTYLAETNVPGKTISYLDFFSGYETSYFKQLINDPSMYNKDVARLAAELDSNKDYGVVFTYVKGNREIEEWANALDTQPVIVAAGAGAAAGGALAAGGVIFLVSNPAGWVVAGVGAVGALIGGGVQAVSEFYSDNSDAHLSTISLVEWKPGVLQDLKCKELPVGIAEI